MDAVDALPFRDDYFDVVISFAGLPGYARNPKEAVTSMLEMLRVAKERVVVQGSGFKEDDPEGAVSFGVKPYTFIFAFRTFLEFLKKFGISYEIKTQKVKTSFKEYSTEVEVTSIHIDASGKDAHAFQLEGKKIIENADNYLREYKGTERL